MKKFISVCLCICIFAAQLSGCSGIDLPISDGPTDAEKLEKIRTSDEYPEILVETAEKCPQTLDYVYNYPELKDKRFDIDLSSDAQSGTVPLFIQWDERWGYAPYGSGFTVNDPNSPDNSAKHWTYDRLSPQISNLWSLLVAI